MDPASPSPASASCCPAPSHPGNIGAAARAMKTMGFGDLALVRPRHFPDPDATAMAAGARRRARRARASVRSLEDGAGGLHARRRVQRARTRPLARSGCAARGRARDRSRRRAAGPRGAGVRQRDLGPHQRGAAALPARWCTIPANPAYSSLNLAAAVQVACYELATCAGAHALPASGARRAGDRRRPARASSTHLEAAVRRVGLRRPATSPAGSWSACAGSSRARASSARRCRLLRGMLARVREADAALVAGRARRTRRAATRARDRSASSAIAAITTPPMAKARAQARSSPPARRPPPCPAPSPLTMKVDDQVNASVA